MDKHSKKDSKSSSSSVTSPTSPTKDQSILNENNKKNTKTEKGKNKKVLSPKKSQDEQDNKMIVQESEILPETELRVDVTNMSHSQSNNLSPMSTATTVNLHPDSFQHPRAPVLSASDAAHSRSSSNPFVRGNFLTSTISGSDLHRFLNSGYLNGDGYLQRGVDPKHTTKSPHFHRPANFSYSKNTPNFVTPSRSSNRGTSILFFFQFF